MVNKFKSSLGIVVLLLMCSLSLVSAELPHEQNTQLNFSVTSNFATSCELTTINSPDGIITIGQTDTDSGTFSFSIGAENFSSLGTYCMNIVCTDGTKFTSGQECREVTPNGSILNISQSVLFGFVFLIIIGLLLFGVGGLGKATDVSWQIFYICLTYITLFCLFFVCWLFSDNYLYDTPILASIFWIIWLILSILFWPFIIIVSGYLLKVQAESLMVQDYEKQGFSKEDSRELARSKRQR